MADLPNSKRLQVIMMQLEEGDKELLLAAKQEVESNWKNTKWISIVAKMEEMGAKKKYPTEFIQKEFKKLQAEAEGAVTDADAGLVVRIGNVEANALLDEALQAGAFGGEETEEEEE
ncbi:MAG: hypothetical protein LQ350_002675 [Teloschistes chrysophthalmus]|nr:MAG: hypothetical protein LQ350_002675 [Niorma chrysophthalma]